MQLRSGAGGRRLSKRRASGRAAAQRDDEQEQLQDPVPTEIMHMMSSVLLRPEDIATASAACKSWAKQLRAGITAATLVVGQLPSGRCCPLHALRAHSPALAELRLLLSTRSSYNDINAILSRLPDMPKLTTLRLVFKVSSTPKKGTFPLFFADALNASRIDTLALEGPRVPSIALLNLLRNLTSADAPQRAAQRLTRLEFRLGQPALGSQLRPFRAPAWLVFDSSHVSGLDAEMLEQLAKLPSLRDVSFELAPSSGASSLKPLAQLTALSSLRLSGPGLDGAAMRQLAKLRGLRRLACTLQQLATPGDLDVVAAVSQLRELELGLESPPPCVLEALPDKLPPCLRGLTIANVALVSAPGLMERLARLSGLTALLLCGLDAPLQLDLTPLSRLTLLRFGLQLATAPSLMQIKFEPPPVERSGPCRSAGKRTKAKAAPSSGDLAGLFRAWPGLEQLQLCGLPRCAAHGTNWSALRRLTCLTSLALQFSTQDAAEAGVDGPVAPSQGLSVPEGLPLLRLEHLPASLVQLRLANCCACVPDAGCLPFGGALTSLSLAQCAVRSVHKGANARGGAPAFVAAPRAPPLVALLRELPQLAGLELLSLPWLDDALLAAAAAHLGGVSRLSVVGIGNPRVTHGGLLGLTPLVRLRELRWHVGDALEPLPDVAALARLKGLAALHVPTWLHAQMERWGGYAVLESLPLCDVHVEVV